MEDRKDLDRRLMPGGERVERSLEREATRQRVRARMERNAKNKGGKANPSVRSVESIQAEIASRT